MYNSEITSITSSMRCAASGDVDPVCAAAAAAAAGNLEAREEVNVRIEEYEYAVVKCVHCVVDGAGPASAACCADTGVLERDVMGEAGSAFWRWSGSARYAIDSDGRVRVGVGARGCNRENERVGWKDGRRAGGGLRRRARRAGVRESIAAGCNARGVV